MAGGSVLRDPFPTMVMAARGMSEMQEVMQYHMLPLHDMRPSPEEKTKPSQKNLRPLHGSESRNNPSQ